MEKWKAKKGIIIAAILIIAVVAYYFYLSNKATPVKEETEPVILSEVQKVLLVDLEKNYPQSPKEVVKYFCEISSCFYNEEYSEEELQQLASKIREIYDDELVAKQTDEQYLDRLKIDIEEYKTQERTIANYSPSSSIDVETFSEDGFEWARLYCFFSIKQKGILYNVNTQFLLRKDKDGHYKIYGWKNVEK